MTKDEMIKDSESFRGKPNVGYIHGEVNDQGHMSLFLTGDRDAVEAMTIELIGRIAEIEKIPVELLLTKMLLLHKCSGSEEKDDDLGTLEIE